MIQMSPSWFAVSAHDGWPIAQFSGSIVEGIVTLRRHERSLDFSTLVPSPVSGVDGCADEGRARTGKNNHTNAKSDRHFEKGRQTTGDGFCLTYLQNGDGFGLTYFPQNLGAFICMLE